VRAFLRRTWGEHGRILRGHRWEPGEREVHRDQLPSISVFSVDRHTTVARQALCILTDRRLAILDSSGGYLEIRLGDIRTARTYREYDPERGSCWSVALSRLESGTHDPRGDICLLCKDERQSAYLSSLIRDKIPDARAIPSRW
jgi:hypothetical protein